MLSSQDQGQPTYSGMMPLCFVTKLAPEAVLEAATLFLQMLSFLATFGSSAYKHGYWGGPREDKQLSGSEWQSEKEHHLYRLFYIMLGLFILFPFESRYWSFFSTAFSYDLFLVKKWTGWMNLKTNFEILKAVLLLKSLMLVVYIYNLNTCVYFLIYYSDSCKWNWIQEKYSGTRLLKTHICISKVLVYILEALYYSSLRLVVSMTIMFLQYYVSEKM